MMESIRTLESLELVGGALCLDFVNTVNSRRNPEHEYLVRYSDLVGWADKAGILSPIQARRLQTQAKHNAQKSETVLSAARQLRELLYRLFSTMANGSEPSKPDRDTLVESYGKAISRGKLIKQDGRYALTWKVDQALNSILWPIIHSAGELLLSEQLHQVKECPGCGWLFLDTSKNQSRRWCSMNTCGARDKMRRYHKRRRVKS